MPLTTTEARDAIGTLLKTALDTLDLERVIWDGTRGEVPKEGAEPVPSWARVLIRHITSEQATLSDKAGCRRFTRRGLVTVQMFTPTGDGLSRADEFSTVVRNAMEGVSTPGGVWFRDVRLVEVGEDGPWFQVNVLADFQYDEVR